MNPLQILSGVLRYEYRMQIRRPALWLAFLAFGFLNMRTVLGQLSGPYFASIEKDFTLWQLAAFVTIFTNWLAPLGVGILLADRLTRDRRTRVDELLIALPGSLKMRLLGKYLGTTLASLTAAFLLFLLTVGLAVLLTGNVALVPYCLVCYIVTVLPGMLFVSAFSLALPVVIWVPLYQFLFFGYWFWGNMLVPGYGLPTLSGTILTPVGSFIGAGLFGVSTFGSIHPAPTIYGLASIAALLGIAALVIVALYQFMRWEQARQ